MANITTEQFDKALLRVIESKTATEILRIKGVYEVVAEELNNDAIDEFENPTDTKERDFNKLVRALSDYVNCGRDIKTLAAAMVYDHPTLQQGKMRLCVEFIRQMAGKAYFDGRNEASVLMAREIVGAITDDSSLPLI
jgi:hypothetical protein